MKKIKSLLFLILALVAVSNVAYAVDYSLGGYLNGQDVTNYNANWKMTQSGSDYVITKTFSTTDNYFVIYDSNNKKYGVNAYTTDNPSTLVQNGNEKVGAIGLSTSSPTTITFNPSTNQISWTTSGSGTSSGSLREPYVISVYKEGWGEEYTFTPVLGSTNYEYEVTIEIPNYTGNTSDYKFWVGYENRWSDTYSENESLNKYVPECGTGVFYAKIYALDENGQPHGSDYKNFGIHDFRCSESSATLTLTSSVREFDTANPPTSITLTATANEKTEGNYIWYFSSDGGTTYNKLGETTTNTLTLSDGNIPSEPRWDFKVARKVVGNNLYKEAFCVIYTIQSCGADTKGSNIFHEDFGTLTNEDSRGAKDTYNGIVSGYTYQVAPYKVNDGFYAVVANPYYSGCGDGSDNDNKVDDACIQRIQWFRDLPDHTLYNDTETGPYGGMLLINFKEGGIAYQRELNTTEAKNIRKNSILTFSAYFASAAKERDGVDFNPIKMEMNIQFLKNGETTWDNVATISSEVTEREGWQRSQVAWTVTDDDGKFRVVIDNKGAGTGSGNDLLVDDIRLDLCTPAFAMHFYDETNNKEEVSVEAVNVKEERTIRVQKIDFGSLGQTVCLQAYQVHVNGVDTTYTYLTDMVLDGEYYNGNVTPELFTTIPQTALIACVASALDDGKCNDAIKELVVNGTYKPGQQNNAVFSSNILEYSIPCGTAVLSQHESISKICESINDEIVKLPILKLTSRLVSEDVKCDIYVNDGLLIENITYKEETPECGFMLLDINTLYKEINGTDYLWTAGDKVLKVKLKQTFKGNLVCEEWANGDVQIQVVARPKFTENLQNEIKICEGESKELEIQATSATKYQWQTRNGSESEWTDVGTSSNTFTVPNNIINGTQYRVLLYNDLMCATVSEVVTVDVQKCEDLQLTSKADVDKVCLDDEFIYTVSLYNNSPSTAEGVRVVLEWDDTELKLDESQICSEFNIITKQWFAGIFPTKSSASVGLKFKVIKKVDEQIKLKAYVSMMNSDTYGSYDEQTDDKLKGETVITFNEVAETPLKKRKGETYALNICKGDKTYGELIPFNFLIEDKMEDGSDFDKSNLIWMDENKNVIDAESAKFSVHEVQDVTLYVYNQPEGYCKSDVVEVRYRVKEITEAIKVKDYKECAVELQEGETSSPMQLADLVENADSYKYLIFTNTDNVKVTEFDASKPGSATYNIVASQDELESAENNYCEATAEISVDIKENAKKANISANGANVCPNSIVELTAESEFTEPQTGVKIRWYSDAGLGEDNLVCTESTYKSTFANDITLYVTVETDNYCENTSGYAKEVSVTLKAASPQISIEPEEPVITIGGEAKLVVSPAEISTAPQLQLYANDVLQPQGQIKPYIDTEYIMMYKGECGTTSDTAKVYVQWPTVFTPYVKDGRNDTFVTDMNPNFYTQIFTRFGTKIYESENGWDGSVNGSMNGSSDIAAPGVYYYVVELPDGNVKKGTIEVFKY